MSLRLVGKEEGEDSEKFHCHCGEVVGPDDFDDDAYGEPCGGMGELHCLCGGDFCVCHNHGTVQCPGCEDCEPGDSDLDDERLE